MSSSPKQPHAKVMVVAKKIVTALAPFCERIEIAGSLRRNRPMVGDIEIVAMPKVEVVEKRDLFGCVVESQKVVPLHKFLVERGTELIKGKKPDAKYKQFQVLPQYGGCMVDLFMPASPEHWGSGMFIRTGSHKFNMWVMNVRAPEVGVRFEGGLIYKNPAFLRGGPVCETPEEGDVFEALEMDFVPPEDRDDWRWMKYIKEGDGNESR